MRFVFVYGTLMSGEGANRYLDGCKCLGTAQFDGSLGSVVSPATGATIQTSRSMLCLPGHGGFPAITAMDREDARELNIQVPHNIIRGEVYELPVDNRRAVSEALDRYEGYPRLYGRTERVVYLDKNMSGVRAWLYYMIQDAQQLEQFRVIDSGSWKDREATTPYFDVVEQGAQQAPGAGLDAIFTRVPGLRGARIRTQGIDYEYFAEDEPEEMEG